MFSGGRHLWFFRRPLPSFLQDHTSCRHGFQNTETSHEVIFRNASSAGTLTCEGSMIEISILVIYVCLFQQTFTYSKQKHEILFQKVKFSFKKALRDESIKNSTLLLPFVAGLFKLYQINSQSACPSQTKSRLAFGTSRFRIEPHQSFLRHLSVTVL